jgi:hypothetical protein
VQAVALVSGAHAHEEADAEGAAAGHLLGDDAESAGQRAPTDLSAAVRPRAR